MNARKFKQIDVELTIGLGLFTVINREKTKQQTSSTAHLLKAIITKHQRESSAVQKHVAGQQIRPDFFN